MRWSVTITETVSFRVMAIADTEEDARAQALELHNDGMSAEIDSGPAEVESIEAIEK